MARRRREFVQTILAAGIVAADNERKLRALSLKLAK
jgi:hypothetical protein